MERPDLDIRLSVFDETAGGSPAISTLVLYVRLRADDDGPRESAPEFLALCRDEPGAEPSMIAGMAVTDQDLARLRRLLAAAGFPRRVPRVVAKKGPSGSCHYVALEARIDGRTALLDFRPEQAGISGEDSEPVRAVLGRLAELAAVGGLSEARAVVDRVIGERPRRDSPGPRRDGLTPADRFGSRRWTADRPAGLHPRAGARDDDPGVPPSATWEFLTDP
jgi:hypothetical protein